MAPAAFSALGAALQRPLHPPQSASTFSTSLLTALPSASPDASIQDADNRSYPPKCHMKPPGQTTEDQRKSKANQAWDTADSIWQAVRAKADSILASYGQDAEILDQDTVPDYVFTHAPYVHLYSGEQFWPCSLDSHLLHTTPHLNYTPITTSSNLTVANLSTLNTYGFFTYLQSDDNVESRPTWLAGTQNIPSDPSSPSSPNTTSPGGHSSAPAILLTIRKPNNVLDAFWFYFYSYNLGNKVGLRFGNHVGDWEHTLVRFQHGRPTHVFLSEHNFGEAYAWSAMEKIGKRPVTFSATGSHAMYATPGSHPYVLPWGLLHDQTDRGPLWDPTQNVYTYTFDLGKRELRASTRTPDAPTDWFYYRGHWGDRAYPLSDERQYKFAGQYHYVSGPLGPIYKNLARKEVCQGRGRCRIKYWLPPLGEVKMWEGEDGEGPEDEGVGED
ncbi:VPS62-like protein 2 [Elsinoe fawcettii]|nr:VPS62-like protein 2 [Elsinoe fawcettii]